MSVFSAIFAVGVSLSLQGATPLPAVDLLRGVLSLWSPGLLVTLLLTWLALVCFTGISSTTYSRISFHLLRDRI